MYAHMPYRRTAPTYTYGCMRYGDCRLEREAAAPPGTAGDTAINRTAYSKALRKNIEITYYRVVVYTRTYPSTYKSQWTTEPSISKEATSETPSVSTLCLRVRSAACRARRTARNRAGPHVHLAAVHDVRAAWKPHHLSYLHKRPAKSPRRFQSNRCANPCPCPGQGRRRGRRRRRQHEQERRRPSCS